jgi:predicted MFS family arabinose efflux permease
MLGQGSSVTPLDRTEDRQVNRVLFAAGFTAFALLYASQGMLPAVSEDFDVSPAQASLTVSLTTLPLAVGVVVGAALSERHGRRRLLVGSLLMAAALSLVTAASPTFAVLLVLRVLTGLALAGLPAVAMAYLAEEVRGNPGAAMGLYISATGLGGLTGRLAGGLLAGVFSWRVAIATVAVAALACSAYVARRLPPSRHFHPQPESLGQQLRAGTRHFADPVLRRLFVCGFVLMGGMVAYFNFQQYRLEAPPFGLTQGTAALVFLLYLAGTVSANWMGRLTDRRGRRSVLVLGIAIMLGGLLLTLPTWLPTILAGTALVTFGFFGAHANVSGWVNGQARQRRAQASSLYLLFYHLGSSLLGFAGGIAYSAGWNVLVLMIGFGLLVALLMTSGLPRTVLPTAPAVPPGSEP